MSKKVVQKGNARQFAGVLLLIAVAGIAGLGYALTRPKTVTATINANIPPGPVDPHVMGKPDAPVKVIEFGDFECPACGQFANVTEPDVRARLVNTGLVSFEFYDMPLPMHKNTWPAHIAASCADTQGKFWEMHDRLFNGQDEWNGEATSNPKKVLKRYAGEIGLDVSAWETCFDAQTPVPRIKGNEAEGTRRNVSGTPTFFIGDKQAGPVGFDEIKRLVDEAVAAQKTAAGTKQQKGPPAAAPKKAATP